MTKYIRGLQRQRLIERWKMGYEDPDYEVFPTRKEGKYIVKKRTEPFCLGQSTLKRIEASITSDMESNKQAEPESENEIEPPTSEKEMEPETSICGTNSAKQNVPIKQFAKANYAANADVQCKPISQPKSKPRAPIQVYSNPSCTQTYEQNQINNFGEINLEILEQLKQLGSEIKQQRKKKDQKDMIKRVVEKQLTKTSTQSRKRKVQIESDPEYEEEEETDSNPPLEQESNTQLTPEVIQQTSTFRSRIRR